MTITVEQVRFRTKAGVKRADFLAAAEQISPWLKSQPGFAYRSLVEVADGEWQDSVYWMSAEAAKAATEAFMAAPETKAFGAMIEDDSVSMNHWPEALSVMADQMEPA
ncbi:hypothetical protein [Oceanomicrobium pacificus]|uniref:ABM domain-containing protein n=1 Tax=Oceanomicrobium pacificus TaxID=2692916 RepID=A0A6B0TYT6_9RHOB|nr:hypothetical protein [Oceanomicrobium pacificus]MXU66422.1 hypothetical protein [Oceanomicrobium pacificus]